MGIIKLTNEEICMLEQLTYLSEKVAESNAQPSLS